MKRVFWVFTVLILISTGTWMTALAKRSKEGQARLDKQTQNFVKRAAILVAEQGRVVAACAFNDPKGRFQRGSEYIFAITCGNQDDAGFIVADPVTPEYNYTNRKKKSLIIQKIVHDSYRVLQNSGKWYEYCWLNPVTHLAQLKRSYVIMIPKENLCIGSGYYLRKPCTFEG